MVHRFSIGFDWDEHGQITGTIPSLQDCSATGNDLEEMLDKLEEEARKTLAAHGESSESEIELVSYNSSVMLL